MRILFTGGSGLLGRHLIPLLKERDGDGHLFPRVEVEAPTHEELDITQPIYNGKYYNIVVHAAAYTDVAGAEVEKGKCFETNVNGTINLLNRYSFPHFIYISSEYAKNPINYYSETKRAAEVAVRAYASKYTIIRTLFKDNPFPYEKAFRDQWTQGDYVDVIAPLLADFIYNDEPANDVIYIGTGRKTMLDLARRSRPEIKDCSITDVRNVLLPADYQ